MRYPLCEDLREKSVSKPKSGKKCACPEELMEFYLMNTGTHRIVYSFLIDLPNRKISAQLVFH